MNQVVRVWKPILNVAKYAGAQVPVVIKWQIYLEENEDINRTENNNKDADEVINERNDDTNGNEWSAK